VLHPSITKNEVPKTIKKKYVVINCRITFDQKLTKYVWTNWQTSFYFSRKNCIKITYVFGFESSAGSSLRGPDIPHSSLKYVNIYKVVSVLPPAYRLPKIVIHKIQFNWCNIHPLQKMRYPKLSRKNMLW
jgi:hypothetical protein